MADKMEKFALTNPISIICDKDHRDITRDDLIKVIKEKEIERITFHYTAIDGKLRELIIPVQGRQQVELILTEGERIDGSSIFKGMIDSSSSDLYVVPVYKTAFINPFDTKSLDFICRFINKDGDFAPFAFDNILYNAKNRLEKNTGLELHALGELEFFLIGRHQNNDYPLEKQKGYHATAPYVKSGYLINEMLNYITQISGRVKYAHNEVGYIEHIESENPDIKGKTAGQVEIEFQLSPIDEAADNVVLASWIIRNVAYKHGFIATFFPKLDIGHAGSGLHFHTALYKGDTNVVSDAEGELTEDSRCLIGGMCHYAQSLTAFGNMCSASYMRLVPHQEAPTKVCWSDLNRSALIRVPLAWTKVNNLASKINPQQKELLKPSGSRQTVEIRSPDGSANTHLLLAGISLAAEWGLTNKKDSLALTKNCHVIGNVHASNRYDELSELPTSCWESAEILLQHRNLYEADNIFPTSVISYVVKYLQNENDRNLNQLLTSLPEEEKIEESRRIMHKNFYKH